MTSRLESRRCVSDLDVLADGLLSSLARRSPNLLCLHKQLHRRKYLERTDPSLGIVREMADGAPAWITNGGIISDTCACSLQKFASVCALTERMEQILLERFAIKNMFPVQSAIVPYILNHDRCGVPVEICVTAPTGSGKTLSYVIPIVEVLCAEGGPSRLRCVVIQPTRDLASQVAEVFRTACIGTPLRVEMVVGESSFAQERSALVSDLGTHGCDVLVATPGKLLDHLNASDGSILNSLRFLVVDEADRLLRQSYFDWVSQLNSFLGSRKGSSCLHRVHFSATITHNPGRLSQLLLSRPRYFSFSASGSEIYKLPDGLAQKMVVCTEESKGPAFFALLMKLMEDDKRAIVFASSVETAHRLRRVLELGRIGSVWEFSSAMGQEGRRNALQLFAQQGGVLVSSDAMARGLDLDNVDVVINYDAPMHVSTYVHRAGRTARGGRTGTCYTYVFPREVHHFRQVLGKCSFEGKVSSEKAAPEASVGRIFNKAVQRVHEVLAHEKLNILSPIDSLSGGALQVSGDESPVPVSTSEQLVLDSGMAEKRSSSRMAASNRLESGLPLSEYLQSTISYS